MKKFLVILFCLIGLVASAETQWYKANSYAYKQINSYGYWTNWTNWISCDINIKFDLSSDIIVIYSNRTQVYKVTSYNGQYPDNNGGVQAHYRVYDQDGDYGTLRLRIESNGNSQIYVEFANVMWVYNVIRYR